MPEEVARYGPVSTAGEYAHDLQLPPQLADGLGSIRESVARTIGDFRRHGWIITTRYGIVLRDREAVAAYGAVS